MRTWYVKRNPRKLRPLLFGASLVLGGAAFGGTAAANGGVAHARSRACTRLTLTCYFQMIRGVTRIRAGATRTIRESCPFLGGVHKQEAAIAGGVRSSDPSATTIEQSFPFATHQNVTNILDGWAVTVHSSASVTVTVYVTCLVPDE